MLPNDNPGYEVDSSIRVSGPTSSENLSQLLVNGGFHGGTLSPWTLSTDMDGDFFFVVSGQAYVFPSTLPSHASVSCRHWSCYVVCFHHITIAYGRLDSKTSHFTKTNTMVEDSGSMSWTLPSSNLSVHRLDKHGTSQLMLTSQTVNQEATRCADWYSRQTRRLSGVRAIIQHPSVVPSKVVESSRTRESCSTATRIAKVTTMQALPCTM
jgi:hypothetical protein